MVRNNNCIPNGHFHKKWQTHLKLWFSQPKDKVRRKAIRVEKQLQHLPTPVKRLRPIIHCPSARYNHKIRAGRGFTMKELKQANIHYKFASTIGIAVDRRRRNKSYETIAQNVLRLKEYRSNLIMLPTKEIIVAQIGKSINSVSRPKCKVVAKVVTDEDKKFAPFEVLRHARNKAKRIGKKLSKKGLTDDITDGLKNI